VTRSTEAGVRRRHHRAVRALIYHLSAVVAGSSGDDGRARHQGRAYDYPPVGDARRPRIREALEPVLASRRHLVAGRRAVYLYPRRVGTMSIEPSTSRARPSAIGAVIGRGRPNGRWHSHRGQHRNETTLSRSKYPVLHQNLLTKQTREQMCLKPIDTFRLPRQADYVYICSVWNVFASLAKPLVMLGMKSAIFHTCNRKFHEPIHRR
jgi:hypothetical protein